MLLKTKSFKLKSQKFTLKSQNGKKFKKFSKKKFTSVKIGQMMPTKFLNVTKTLPKINKNLTNMLKIDKKMGKKSKISSLLTMSLKDLDPEINNIIDCEKQRQKESICLIPSENFTSLSVLEGLGSCMQNKYSEGYPGQRYYGGNEFIDQSEMLCQKRALEAFGVNNDEWGVNVQCLSGSPANFEVYTALLEPHDRIMSLDLPHGGHLSHGYQTPKKKISAVSKYYDVLPYRLNAETGTIDYDTLENNALLYRPKLIVAGASAYSRHIDYDRIRSICDQIGAVMMMDMAHISGLIAAGVMPSPFKQADIVTTTTHKSLRGPRGAMIFYKKKGIDKKGKEYDTGYESKVNHSVFPGHQGGPHNHTITALAIALKQAQSPEFKEYQENVLKNCQSLAGSLIEHGYDLVSGGTDNHLLLIDLRSKGITGSKVERVLELAKIASNKNTVPGDLSALNPGGLRVGTPAMTTRGFNEADFAKVGGLINEGVEIALNVQKQAGNKKLSEFKKVLEKGVPEIDALKSRVTEFASKFDSIY